MNIDQLSGSVWLLMAAIGFVGIGLGLLLARWLNNTPGKARLRAQLEQVESDFEAHKEKVNEHFVTTSELVNELTESYVRVYKHLSDGASQLSGVAELSRRLTLDEGDARLPSIDGESRDITEQKPGASEPDPATNVSDAEVQATLSELEAEAGPPEAGPPEAGPPEAGLPEAGPPEAGLPEADPPEADPPEPPADPQAHTSTASTSEEPPVLTARAADAAQPNAGAPEKA